MSPGDRRNGARHSDVECPICLRMFDSCNIQQHIEYKHTDEGQRAAREAALKRGRMWWRKQMDRLQKGGL